MNYNWDDIEVDDTLTHNSRYFFANYRCDMKSEEPSAADSNCDENKMKLDLMDPEYEQAAATTTTENKENEPAPNTALPPKSPKYNLRSSVKVESPGKSENSCPALPVSEVIDENNPAINGNDLQSEELDKIDQISTEMDKVALSAPATLAVKNNLEVKPNIVTPSRWAKGAVPKTGPQVPKAPKAYEFSNVYQNKREEQLRKQREEERRMREFTSRPMPHFHPKPVIPNVHYITVPITPKVLKRSKESERKRLQKLEALKQQCQPSGFKAAEYNVPPKEAQPRPFQLRCEQRLRERKEFDHAVQQKLEEKEKEERERRKMEEEAQIKEIRKATTFKARPNPFKN